MVRSLIILSLLASACRPRTDYELRVSNPLPAGDRYPEVVKLIMRDLNGAFTGCSGVFIRPRVLLTAAHCAYDKQGKGVAVVWYEGADGVVHQGKIFPSREFRMTDDFLDNVPYDVAVIRFDTDVAPAIARFAKTPPALNEKVTIVGFGLTDIMTSNPTREKQLGYNYIREIDDNTSVMVGYFKERPIDIAPGSSSVPMNGDSGCGIFNQLGELSGIHSAGFDYDEQDALGNSLKHSYHVNIAHSQSKSVLKAIDSDFCADKNLQPGESCPKGGVCGIK